MRAREKLEWTRSGQHLLRDLMHDCRVAAHVVRYCHPLNLHIHLGMNCLCEAQDQLCYPDLQMHEGNQVEGRRHVRGHGEHSGAEKIDAWKVWYLHYLLPLAS